MARAPKGIVRYNKIRSELSKHIKSEGIKLEPWAFNAMSRDIFRSTKTHPFPDLIENIETLSGSMRGYATVPMLRPEDVRLKEYYEIDRGLPKEVLPENVWIVSPDVYGKDIKIADYRYEIDAKPFVSWVDKNRDFEGEDPDKLFHKSDNLPFIALFAGEYDEQLKGHPAIWNPKKLRWEIELSFVDPSGNRFDEEGNKYNYGYEPGAEGYTEPWVEGAVIPGEVPEEEPVPEPVKKEPPAREPKIEAEIRLKKAETKRLKQETRLKKAESRAARSRLALVKELRELGFNKAEIKAELAKL